MKAFELRYVGYASVAYVALVYVVHLGMWRWW